MKSRYKYKWCTLFGYAPDLHCVPIVFQPPAVPLSSAADWQQILSRITDLSFVLEVVLRKFALCMRLQRLRLYNAVLVASSRSLSDYNCVEFERYCIHSVFDLCVEWV